MDIALAYPETPGTIHGLWPSAVAATNVSLAPIRFLHQEALEFYRIHQTTYAILWKETGPNSAIYRVFGDDRGVFTPDFRCTERGDHELVGLYVIPDRPPPPDEGEGDIPRVPAPTPAHPSMSG